MSFATLEGPSSPLVGLAMALCTERTRERERRWRKIKINKLFCVRKMHEHARRPGNRPTIGPMFGIPEASLCTKGIWNFPDFLGGSVWSHCVANVGLSLRDGSGLTRPERVSPHSREVWGSSAWGPFFAAYRGRISHVQKQKYKTLVLLFCA
jgi:hypothetical protein